MKLIKVVIYGHLACLLRWIHKEIFHFKGINSKLRNCLKHLIMSRSKHYLLLGKSKFYHLLHKTSPSDVLLCNIRENNLSVVAVQVSPYIVCVRS